MKVIGIVIISALLLTTASFAEPARRIGLEVGAEISYMKYKEPDMMEEDGMMYGVSAAYTFLRNKLMLKADGRFSYGQVDYSSPVSGTLDNIDDYNVETRISVGYNYKPSEKASIIPYAGFGYRYLNDDTSGMVTSTGAAGYERESNYLYTPIGLDAMVDLGNGWSLGAVAEYDLFWYGMQRSHLEDVGYGLSTMDNDQKSGWGARGSVKIKKKGNKVDFLIEPFIRYWNIKKSEETNLTYYGFIVGKGWEPKNNSTEIGAKIAVQF